MSSTKIETYQYLKQFPKVHVKINDNFFHRIKEKILGYYGSLRKYSKILKINSPTLRWEFKKNKFHPFYRILQITKDIRISEQELFSNILGFYHWGSHNEYVKIPRFLEIDDLFVEGYALYLAEGDNGSNGLTRPRKFRFTNTDVEVIDRIIEWLNIFFPEIEKYIVVIKPLNYDGEFHKFEIPSKITEDKYNKIVKYRLCADNAILIDLFLSIENEIKDICSKNQELTCAYIRGMMIGEGTVYHNRSRYVRIEMKNGKEIEYIHKLLMMLGYDCKISYRTTRDNMWSIYIGTRQLKKFYLEIGFGIHEKKQAKLYTVIKTTLAIKAQEEKLGIQ